MTGYSSMMNVRKSNNQAKPQNNVNFKSRPLMRAMELHGKETTAKIFTNNIEYKAINQIKECVIIQFLRMFL